MTNFPFRSADDHRDLEAVNYFAAITELGIDEGAALTGLARISRDNARTPMQWDDTPHGGFTRGEPWLAVNPNHTWLNAMAQVDDPASVFAHYRRLIDLRHRMPILAEGDFAPLWEDDPVLWAYTRATDSQRMLVVANCGREPRRLDLPDWHGASLVLGNLEGADPELGPASSTLAAWEARIYLAG
jgi:oligo-1,6-glucosidase